MGFTGSSGPRRTESTHANTCSSPALLLLRDCLAIPAPRSSLPIARRDPRGQAASPSRRFALLRPSSAGPPGLRSSPEFSFQPAPVGGYRPPLLGFVPGTLANRRHCCRSRAHRLDFSAPPSTSSPASTPATTLLPPLRTQAATLGFLVRLRRFARPCRFSPPLARLAPDSSPLSDLRRVAAKDSRACCIPLPILGFATFRLDVGVLRPFGRSLDTHWRPPFDGRQSVDDANACSSQRVSYPPEDSLHPQPHRVTTTVASLMFASRAALVATPPPLPTTTYVRGPRDAAPSRRCSADGCVPTTTVSSGHSGDPPWALVPFEVLRPARRHRCRRVGGCHPPPPGGGNVITRCVSGIPTAPGLRSLPSPSRRLLGVDIAPFRSCILVAHGPTFRLGKRSAAMVPGVSSRTERLSTLLATAKLQVRIASPQTLYCGRGVAEVKAGRFPAVDDQVLGRRHISVPVLGSREDPPELTPLRGNLRGCHSPSCLVSGLAPPFSQAWVFPVGKRGWSGRT
jgi:hypothetical protein